MSTAAFSRGIVRDEPRHHRERPHERRALLIDERAGLEQPALQLCFGLARRRAADEVDGGADRQHGQRGAGEENPVGERPRIVTRYRRLKSASTAPPSSGMTTGRDSRIAPSFHATSV